MKSKLFILSVALISLSTIATAQTPVKGQQTSTKKVQVNNQQSTTQQQGGNYVDANNNKICDNYENNAVQTKGKGLRNGLRSGRGNGLRNGTGCRARVNGTGGAGVGNGNGKRDGSGKGVGNYVDANKNGVCDLKEK